MANIENENERLVGITKVNETDIICGRGGLGMCTDDYNIICII